jgi:hypothetical protein
MLALIIENNTGFSKARGFDKAHCICQAVFSEQPAFGAWVHRTGYSCERMNAL